jgi:primosomal protein N' (replication factor Y)
VQPPVTKCEKCGNDRFRQLGFGTQRLEEELQVLLPDARILRMDADTTMSRSAYETGFRAFAKHEYDILCGTQMIGKGLDFPNVTLVGVISVDNSLFSGDFRSYERTFSLVTQVVGRSGRGDKNGRAILQTFMPGHYVLQLAAEQDYDRFYEEEITLRRALTFPPVCDICVIGISSLMQERAAAAAQYFVRVFSEEMARYPQMPLRVLGPVEAGYIKIKNQWRWRVLIKCKNTAPMRALVRGTIERIYAERTFPEAQFFADMNGDCGV